MQHFLSFWASYSITWPRCKRSFVSNNWCLVWTGSAFPQSFLSCKQSDAERKDFVDIPEQDHSWFYTSLRLFVSFVEEIASPSLLVSSNFRPCIFLRPVSNHTENLLHNLFKTWHFIIKDVGVLGGVLAGVYGGFWHWGLFGHIWHYVIKLVLYSSKSTLYFRSCACISCWRHATSSLYNTWDIFFFSLKGGLLNGVNKSCCVFSLGVSFRFLF